MIFASGVRVFTPPFFGVNPREPKGESLQEGCGKRPDSSLFSRPAEALFEALGHVEGDEAGEVIRIVFADLDDLFD